MLKETLTYFPQKLFLIQIQAEILMASADVFLSDWNTPKREVSCS